MTKWIVAVWAVAIVLWVSIGIVVGDQGPSSSRGNHPAAPASTAVSALTPRPPVVGGGTVEATPFEEVEVAPRPPRAEASAVATQALTATVTVVTTVDAAPATPPAGVAQSEEQPNRNRQVEGSNPSPSSSNEAQAVAAIEAHSPASERATAYRVASCETGGTFDPTKVGRAGEQGIFQVMARYWGAVPDNIDGPARQAAGIVERHGWSPWSCY